MIWRSDLLFLYSILGRQTWAADTRSSDSSRPRGVGPEFAKFYKSSSIGKFTCISNPSITIPFESINDDYCDCPDGSDEPGTAACSYLSPLSPPQYHPGPDTAAAAINTTLALPGFYCKNKGHVPSYLRFESVNDGKCDYELCCDGSDEWAGVGGTTCEDKCKEIGKEYKKSEEVRMKALKGALKRRKEFLGDAEKLKKEVEFKIESLEITLKGYEIKVKQAEDNLVEVERAEKLKAVKSQVVGKGGGKLGVLAGLAKDRVEELRASLMRTKYQRDAMVDRVSELEKLLSALKEDHDPNFNDEGVKRAVRGWETYAARETEDGWSEAEDRDLETILREDGEESGVNWNDFQSDSEGPESDVAALYAFTSYLPPMFRSWIDEKLVSFRQILVENGVLADHSDPSAAATETKAVQAARKTVTDTERDRSNTQNDLDRQREDLKRDYGPSGIFRALKDKCISKNAGEYTYELCFLAATKQKPNKGGGDTNMGNFVGFEIEYVDEEVGTDGKGLGTGNRIVMKHEGGQHCWNGPSRSTRVILACNEDEEIWKVSESEKCVYRMEVGTAAVCQANGKDNAGGEAGNAKDEL